MSPGGEVVGDVDEAGDQAAHDAVDDRGPLSAAAALEDNQVDIENVHVSDDTRVSDAWRSEHGLDPI